MNHWFNRYLKSRICILFLVFTLIMLTVATACKVLPPQPEGPEALTEEQQQEMIELKEYELSQLYQEFRQNIEEAELVITRLQGFSWHRFGDIAWITKDKYGVEKYHHFIDELPSRRHVEPIAQRMAELKGPVFAVWKERPYLEPQSAVEKAEKLSPEEWQALCCSLKDELIDLNNAVKQYELGAEKLLSELRKPLTLNNFGQQFIADYDEESDKYKALVVELIATLDKAIQNAAELEQWELWPSPSVPEA